MAEPRRTFGPVVLLTGLAGGALAMSGSQPWFSSGALEAKDCEGSCLGLTFDDVGVVSSANALALVGLACLGVVLVSRGRFRRSVSVLGLLAAVGGLVAVPVSYAQVPADVREVAEQYGATTADVSTTGWFWIGAVAALLSVLAWLATVRLVPHWPEMGRRYDAPTASSPDAPPDDLWKAMDQGHDPTS